YSFGATFYHALTGQPPFNGPTAFAVLLRHKTEPLVSPQSHNPALSDRTSQLLERCLAKAPQDRFCSFAEVLHHLRREGQAPSPWDDCTDAGLESYLERYRSRRAAYLCGQIEPGGCEQYEFPGHRVLEIRVGDITQQKVDVIVSSDTAWLTMHQG